MSSFIWFGSAWMFSVGVRRLTRTHREKTDSPALIYTSVPKSELMLYLLPVHLYRYNKGCFLHNSIKCPQKTHLYYTLWCFCFLKSLLIADFGKAEPNVCDWSILSSLYHLKVSIFFTLACGSAGEKSNSNFRLTLRSLCHTRSYTFN